VVSADELRHPLSSKARKMIRRAQDDAHKGEHEKAIAELQLALKEPSAVPYARSMMGAEYLRMNRPADALQQLNEAVRLLPHDVATRADFGLALYLTGEKERGEEEVRVALAEDQHNVKTIFLLDKIREQRGEAPRQ
jgi:cytochrome c-type biogenesis protein CcmH/NrfG